LSQNKVIFTVIILALLLAGAGYFLSEKEGKTNDGAKSVNVAAQTAKSAAVTQASFVGSSACAGCHEKETEAWKQSDHHHAMAEANEQNVLGDFNNASFSYIGHTARFAKQDGRFVVSTENGEGKNENFTVTYTLGYKPLQQYLVTFPDGRIQALPFAWDTRAKQDGGQRWFHLYPNDNVTADNPLFWTRPLQNWNHMCGDCHTTDYSKNFSDQTNAFHSHWSELANGCESCHGAGSAHAALMQELKQIPASKLPADLRISRMNTQSAQMDQCGVCHARRSRLQEDPSHEQMLQTWQPELLHESLYHTDGQMQDEVFNMGSFMQSKMYAAGVTCTNCHNPHDGKLKLEGNAVCTQCHVKETYGTPQHHFHPENSSGAQCVSCHMPVHTYMVIDKRHDHRFSIPRPDLSETIGVPNPCVTCHRDERHEKNKNNIWATKVIADHLQAQGKPEAPPEHFATAFWQIRHERLAAEDSFKKLLADKNANSIVKATALSESAVVLSATTLPLIAEQLQSSDALLRVAAVEALDAVPADQRASLLLPMTQDHSRAVRFAIAPLLAGVDKNNLSAAQQSQLAALLGEYEQSLLADSDRGTALVNLANLALAQGDTHAAQQAYEKALQRDEKSLPVLLNYADYWRSAGKDSEAESLLHKALAIYPDSADAHYAYGLLLVRNKNPAAALAELAKAQQLAPGNSQYAYVYGIGLYSSGQTSKALAWLKTSLKKFPANGQIHAALLSYCHEQQYNASLHHDDCENLP
jgi:predicted CXXCH cytochrome family protein